MTDYGHCMATVWPLSRFSSPGERSGTGRVATRLYMRKYCESVHLNPRRWSPYTPRTDDVYDVYDLYDVYPQHDLDISRQMYP